MVSKGFAWYCTLLFFVLLSSIGFGQNVPLGIFYQAVARDNFGKELVNKEIDVRFSIISENPLGTNVYQELHSKVITSRYGVFTLIIGHGTHTGGVYGELSQVNWGSAYHFLKVEVKFESTFIDMGTMQFLAVPYALFAQKSLEPGPQGPRGETGSAGQQGIPGIKGDQGDPATDDQTLSFNGNNLSISGGNTVNLSTLNIPHYLSILGDTLAILGGNKVSLTNQIQDLQLDVNNKLKISKNPSATEIDLTKFLDDKQQLNFNSVNNTLTITGGNSVDLTPIKQDLLLTGNTLTITNKVSPAVIDLTKYMQQLTFTPADSKLEIAGGNVVDLTSLKNDADADPTNEIQDLSLTANKLTITNKTSPTEISLLPYLDNKDEQTLGFNASTNTISISNGNSVSLGSMVAFKAKKNTSETVANFMTDYDFVAGTIEYNDGGAYNITTGIFNAPVAGIYSFNVSYYATGTADSRILKIFLNGSLYEILNSGITNGSSFTRQITMKLAASDKVKAIINVGTGFETGTGSFSGFRVY